MTEQEKIKKAIKHFECMKNDAVVVLDSGFGKRKGESDLLYRNRKMYAEFAIKALEKQIPKIPAYEGDGYDPEGNIIFDEWLCPCCGTRYEVDYDEHDFCPNCGQAIDRSEHSEEE